MAQNNNQNDIFRNQPVSPSIVSLEVAPRRLTPASVSTAASLTYTVDQLLGGLVLRNANGGPRSDTTPSASDISVALGGSYVPSGQSFLFSVQNTSAASDTLALVPGAGVSFSGSPVVLQNNIKNFMGVFSSDVTVTIYNLGAHDYTL